MSWKIALTAAAAGLMSLSAAAPQVAAAKSPLEPGEKPRRQCFWTHQVNSFAAADEKIVNVRVGVKDIYQFEMFGRCPEIDWQNKIALVSRGGSSICTGMDADIVTPTSIGPQRCAVRAVRKLTPEEVKALPKGARP